MANSLKDIILGAINRDFVLPKVSEERLNICKNCPDKLYSLGQCLECDCIVRLKTKYINEQCPKKHW